MFYKKTIIIGLVFLFMLASGIIFFYREKIFNKGSFLNEIADRSEMGQQQDLAHKDEKKSPHKHHHKHGEENHEENHEDDLVKLSEEQIRQLGIQMQFAESGSLLSTLSARGKIILQPNRVAHIIPKVSGIAREANTNIGDFVKAGEILAVLDSQDIATVKASYLATLSKQRLADTLLKREESLYREKISSEQDYLNAKNIYEEAMINVQLANQQLHAFGLSNEEINRLAHQQDPDLRLYQIRAPIDGTVIMRHITIGEFIENNRTIYEIANLSTVWVEIGIYPKDIYQIKKGQMVEVFLPKKDVKAFAHLIYVSPIVGDETITAKAIAELDNSQGTWHPGTFVNVNIVIEKINAPLVIPKEAVQSSEGKDFVFIATPEGFKQRFVKLGQEDQTHVEIVSGLKLGEEYVANKTFILKAELGKSTAEHQH